MKDKNNEDTIAAANSARCMLRQMVDSYVGGNIDEVERFSKALSEIAVILLSENQVAIVPIISPTITKDGTLGGAVLDIPDVDSFKILDEVLSFHRMIRSLNANDVDAPRWLYEYFESVGRTREHFGTLLH